MPTVCAPSWSSIAQGLCQFDYDTISDVILNVRYTSIDGGDKFRKIAVDSVTDHVQRVTELSQDAGLFAVFDLVHDFPSEWSKTMHPAPGADQLMVLNKLNDRLPIFTKGRATQKLYATDVYLLTPASLPSTSVSTNGAESDQPLSSSDAVGTMKSYAAKKLDDLPVGDWQLKFQMPAGVTGIDKMWMVVRYKLLNNRS